MQLTGQPNENNLEIRAGAKQPSQNTRRRRTSRRALSARQALPVVPWIQAAGRVASGRWQPRDPRRSPARGWWRRPRRAGPVRSFWFGRRWRRGRLRIKFPTLTTPRNTDPEKGRSDTVGELRNFIECITDECSVSFTVATFYLDKTGEGQVTLLPATPSKKPVEDTRRRHIEERRRR